MIAYALRSKECAKYSNNPAWIKLLMALTLVYSLELSFRLVTWRNIGEYELDLLCFVFAVLFAHDVC